MEQIQREPILNIPPLTLGVTILLLCVFAAMQFDKVFNWLVPQASFIPADFSIATSYKILSYALLHFGWPHIIMNTTGLLAFGAGIERLLGIRYFLITFIGGVIVGALGHYALYPHSYDPLGGASAGISALFGCVMPLIVRGRSLVIGSLVFVLMNLVIGLIGFADQPGVSIAWQAHIFGFLFGQMIFFIMIRLNRRNAFPAQPIALEEEYESRDLPLPDDEDRPA